MWLGLFCKTAPCIPGSRNQAGARILKSHYKDENSDLQSDLERRPCFRSGLHRLRVYDRCLSDSVSPQFDRLA